MCLREARDVHAQLAKLGHAHVGIAAGVDPVEWRHVHVDVEADAMISAAVFDAQPDRGDFGFIDVNAGASTLP